MKNKKIDSKARLTKLASYTAAAGAVLALGNSANAQTTINATYSATGTYTLDIANDGTNNVHFNATSNVVKITSNSVMSGAAALGAGGLISAGKAWANTNANLVSRSTHMTYISGTGHSTWVYGTIIPGHMTSTVSGGSTWVGSGTTGGHMTWVGGSGYSTTVFAPVGNFNSPTKRYLGVKITKVDGVHYGWIGITSSSYSSITVVDYYLNPTPGQSVLAGQIAAPATAIPVSPWSVALAGGLIGLGGLVAARKRKTA